NDNLYSNNQGMGMVNLETSFDGVSRLLKDQVVADIFTASGQTRSYAGTISSSTKPVRVTVAWTDAPGSTTGNAYKNNLDLTVVVNGTTYKGNVFTGANSIAGGVADARNNVESVFLPVGTSGNVTITVAATNINSDGVPNYGTTVDQDFALVAYNLAEANPPPIVVMTAPTEGATVLPSAAVTLTATATDLTLTGSAGVVSKVEFFDGTTSLGSVNSAPYSISWSPTVSGVRVLTAKATDNENAVGISPVVNLRVLSGIGQPTLTSFSPTSGVGGSLVTISGDNFAVGAGSSVRFNGVDAAFTVDSLNQITATVPASATTGVVTVTTAYGTVTSLGNYTVVPIVLSEDFAALTSGDNTSTTNQSTPWTGDYLFLRAGLVKAYQAGGAVKLGANNAGSNGLGLITSKPLDLSGGAFDVSFDVNGWTTVEGGIVVTATGQAPQTVTYTSVRTGSFETKVVRFSAGTATTTITLATTAKRAFLDNIVVIKSSSSVTAPVISSSLAPTGTVGIAFSYQITASGSPTSFGATGLPGGLGINTSTGAITGTPTSAGTSNVTI
ncbi:MAG: IPT/TIG domain-containing protein, partial [Bacteroidetes bacterium]|nr:IPT/TIG domain-containing protein [Bacteroidota bacterium]